MDDLDKLIAEPHDVTVGKWEAFGRGAAQGATLGFGDELAGVAKAMGGAPADWLYQKLHAGDGAGPGFAGLYRQGRDETRAANDAAQKARPGYYLGGNFLGGAAPATIATILTGGAGALPIALGEGTVSGLGTSDESSLGGLARDAGAGTLTGLAGYGLGAGVGKAFSGLASKAGAKAGAAAARAEAQAAEDVAARVATAKGELGAETQKGSRYIENLMRLKESMTPEQLAAYEQLHGSGVIPELQQSVAQGTLEALPAQAERIGAKRATLASMLEASPDAVSQRTAELSRSQVGQDALSYARSYGEPLVAAYLANKAGDALGMSPEHRLELAGAAGLIFGRTRGGKALMNRVNRPGNQLALWNMVQGTANAATSPNNLASIGRRAIIGSAVVPGAAYAADGLDERAAQSDAMEKLLRSRGVPVINITPRGTPDRATQDDLDKLLNEGQQ